MASDCMRSKLVNRYWVYGKDYYKDGFMPYPHYHPAGYSDECKNLEIRDDDIFFTGFPRSGTHIGVELIQSVQNVGNKDFLKKHIHDRVEMVHISKDVMTGKVSLLEYGENPLPRLSAQPSPRFLFGPHLPYEFCPLGIQQGNCKVIVGFRNPKSVYTSCFHAIDGISDTGIFSERISKEDFMAAILTGDSRNMPCCGSWFDFHKQWWENKNENIYFLNYENLIQDCHKVVKEVANFLGKALTEEQVSDITDHVKFDKIKENPAFGKAFENLKDVKTAHMRKGKIDDWKNFFTVAQSEQFDELYAQKMKDTDFPQPIYE
ncbi:unnamed protein product [Owenia fusiformis]|uniref:Sulfotransferase domain-containing protein n=1 Tax=Owenia fusiformis TaxID=6347 RepID=A0A8S4QC31_OWEFU|nr:unnamed protein product [Owenia fusiformis]